MAASTDSKTPQALDSLALRDACAAIGAPLSEEQVAVFERYSAELVDWNERLNLTRITDPHGIAVRHIADSLVCLRGVATSEVSHRSDEAESTAGVAASARSHGSDEVGSSAGVSAGVSASERTDAALASHDDTEAALGCIDVGSGAGLPGIPLAVVRPTWTVALLEATGKKARFLEHVSDALELDNTSVEAGRAELLGHDPAHREAYDLAVARAVADTAVLVEYCLPLLRIGGRMLALKGQSAAEDAEASAAAIEQLGGHLVDVAAYELPDSPGTRHLVIVDKISPTPDKFPRRPGVPRRKPL